MRNLTRPRADLFGSRQNARSAGNEVQLDQNLEQLSRAMDSMFRIPVLGWRFGLDSILGLIPGVGDTATTMASFYILASAVRYGVPKVTMLRMGLNIAVDYVVGAVPVVGDLFDAYWKSNQKNLALLRQRATRDAGQQRSQASDWLFVGTIMLILIGLLLGSLTVAYLILRWVMQQAPSLF